MRTMPIAAKSRAREPTAIVGTALGDVRFRSLVGDADWHSLPVAIRSRFSRRLEAGASAVYAGRITQTSMCRIGWLLAQAARIIGAPLPLYCEHDVASVVTVTEDGASGGQVWTRLYARRCGFPQMIHSAKRFAGPTGLEEHVGRGIGMALRVAVRNGALEFHSAGYFIQLFGHRFALPEWATPGALVVTHAETGPGRFRFMLVVTHPHFGVLIEQVADYQDAVPL